MPQFIYALQSIGNYYTTFSDISSKFVAIYGTHFFQTIIAGSRSTIMTYGKSSMSESNFEAFSKSTFNAGFTFYNIGVSS